MQSLWHVSREAHLISTRCMDLASFHRSSGIALYLYLKCCMNLFVLPRVLLKELVQGTCDVKGGYQLRVFSGICST
jgi:hypothetical protein